MCCGVSQAEEILTDLTNPFMVSQLCNIPTFSISRLDPTRLDEEIGLDPELVYGALDALLRRPAMRDTPTFEHDDFLALAEQDYESESDSEVDSLEMYGVGFNSFSDDTSSDLDSDSLSASSSGSISASVQ